MQEKSTNRKPMRCPNKAEREATRAAREALEARERALAAVPVPDDVEGDAYIAAYRKGWVARDAGRPLRDNPWPMATSAAPGSSQRNSYHVLWKRAWNDCGRARCQALRHLPLERLVR
jgi:hypothetical protein